MRDIVKVIVVTLFMYLPLHSNAWGVQGHRVIGEIADSYLSADARREIKLLLGNESVAMSSNWMDFIKSDTTYKYLSKWHYLNIRPAMGKDDFMNFLKSDTSTHAYTKIQLAIREIKNKALPLQTRAMYLRILIHLVGDIHQPLHVGRPDDEGGNKIKLLWFNDNVNLHQVWDERLVSFQQLSYTEYAKAINFTTKAQRETWQKEPLSQWFWDSYQYAEKIYADVKPDEKLGYHYNFKYVATVNSQLLKGGVHLAGLLNEIFD